ncbi:MAG: hypothetical protein CMF46_05655 [Legionellales bacterium]|nr:hypothetical protein [Legionellales bacterium]|tara:strand:+ start:40 stop:393 length:354 start_codon:yes stop_codon:yes gene_type:complete
MILKATEIIQVDQGIKMYHNDHATYYELLGLFVQELKAYAEELSRIKSEKDIKQACFIAHKIRGSASYCAIPVLHQTAQSVEDNLLANLLADYDNQVESLLMVIGQVLDAYSVIDKT